MRTLTGETKYLEREKQQGEKQDLRKKIETARQKAIVKRLVKTCLIFL